METEQVTQTLLNAIRSRGFDRRRNPEIAFYGGTFTNLPFDRMIRLLGAAFAFVEDGYFHGIRISTRPDALNQECLDALKAYGVLTVELGVQSMDDRVLALSGRGHSSEDTVNAVIRLKDHGYKVGVQLMPGLPGDSREIFLSTVEKVVLLKPDLARLYPALVIQGTGLKEMYERGEYKPLTLDEAVDISVKSCIRLESNGIPVIRIGLMSSPDLLVKGQIVDGPWHPAFGFLVRSGIYQQAIEPLLVKTKTAKSLKIRVSNRDIPLLRGYKNKGLEFIKSKTGAASVFIRRDDAVPSGSIKVEIL